VRNLLPWESPLRNVSLDVGGGIGVIFVLLIGPWEYARLKRKGRLRKGWVSFAALVLIFVPIVLVWGEALSPRTSKFALLELWDEDRVQTFALLRPSTGGTIQ